MTNLCLQVDGRNYLPDPFYEALAIDTGLLLQDPFIDFTSACFESSKTIFFAHLFKTARLNQLKRLTLRGSVHESVKQDLAIFLSHHPKLEALWLGNLGAPKIKES
jgi:hypothetical protein